MRFFCLICFCIEGLFRGIYKFHVLLILLTKVTYRSSLYRVQSYEYIFKKQVFVGYCFFEKKILSLQVKLGEVCFFEI